MNKPRLTFGQLWNMNFGFLGIQFGWGLQLANISAIYAKLGAHPDEIPFLWLAGPVTGLIVQPIIGAMSDRTWCWLGRRRPYFTAGAILSTMALLLLPASSTLFTAAVLLWVLDTSINVSMEPFRAFVADKLNKDQRTVGFVMQSFFIGVGQTLANVLPWVLRRWGVTGTTSGGVPLSVLYSFRFGALMFLAAVLWTVCTSKEHPPEQEEAAPSGARGAAKPSLVGRAFEGAREIGDAVKQMPITMRQLAPVQVFTWLGCFCMWMFFNLNPVVTNAGMEWGGVCFGVYSVVCFLVAFPLPKIAQRFGRARTHAVALACGAAGLLSVRFIHDPQVLLLTMVGFGIAWASILAMPYAMISDALPAGRFGVYMGIFNFFIVLPELLSALTFKHIVKYVFNNDPVLVVMLGGTCMLVAAGLAMRVKAPVAAVVPLPRAADAEAVGEELAEEAA